MRRRRSSLTRATLGLLLVAGGCGSRGTDPANIVDVFAAVAAPVAVPTDPVVARVNGTPIHESEARARALQRGLAPGDAQKTAALVDDLILEDLLAGHARSQGLERDPEVRHAARRAMVQAHIEEAFEKKLAERPIPEDLLRRAYDTNYWYYNRPELRGFQHFLVMAKPTEPPARHLAAEAFAHEVLKLVLSRKPKSFHDVADEVRKRSAAAGLQVLVEDVTESRVKLEKDFADALFALAEGTTATAVVRSRFGYHVLRNTTIAPAVDAPFERVKEDVAKKFTNQYRQISFRRWLTELRQRYDAKLGDAAHFVFRDPKTQGRAPPAK